MPDLPEGTTPEAFERAVHAAAEEIAKWWSTSGAGHVRPAVEAAAPFLLAAERERAEKSVGEQNHWIRLFNRLEAAVSRHIGAKSSTGFCDDADDALHAAHARVLKAAAGDTGGER